MGIKNWYVEVAKIETSNEAYYAYLLDKRRHQSQSIDTLNGGLKSLINFERSLLKYKEQNKKAQKAKSAHSMILTLPKGTELTNEVWDNVSKDTFKEFYEYLLNNQRTRKRVFDESGVAVMAQSYSKKNIYDIYTKKLTVIKIPTVMRQKMKSQKVDINISTEMINKMYEDTIIVKHKGNHIHTINPKIVNDNGVMVNIDYGDKKHAYELKKIFNKNVLKYANMDTVSHQVDENYKKALRKQEIINKRRLAKEEAIANDLANIAKKKLLENKKENVKEFEEVKAKMINDLNEQNEAKRFEILYDKAIIENDKFDFENQKLEFEVYKISREAKLDKQELFNDKESAVKDTIDALISKETDNKNSVSVEEIKAVVIELIEVIKLGNLGLLDMKQFKTIDIQLSKGHTTRALSQVKTIKNALNSTSFNEASKIAL